MKTYLWQDPAFPHFYHNPAVVKPLEEAFRVEVAELDRRLGQELKVIHEGVSKDLVHEKMTEFIQWYNQCPSDTPLVNAVQGHIHFETIHPFCDGNGRIGRNLILMGLCRDLGRSTPLYVISESLMKED